MLKLEIVEIGRAKDIKSRNKTLERKMGEKE